MANNTPRNHRIAALLISTAIFAVSLTQETFYINREGQQDAWANGFGNLLLGIFSGNPSWMANLAIIAAWITTQKRSVYPILLSIIAFLFGFSFYFYGEITGNEAGHKEFATDYLIGYWLWLTSMVVYTFYHVAILLGDRQGQKSLSS